MVIFMGFMIYLLVRRRTKRLESLGLVFKEFSTRTKNGEGCGKNPWQRRRGWIFPMLIFIPSIHPLFKHGDLFFPSQYYITHESTTPCWGGWRCGNGIWLTPGGGVGGGLLRVKCKWAANIKWFRSNQFSINREIGHCRWDGRKTRIAIFKFLNNNYSNYFITNNYWFNIMYF